MLFACLLSACSGVQAPELPYRHPLTPSPIAKNFSAREFRDIATQLAPEPAIKALHTFLTPFTDEELEKIADFASATLVNQPLFPKIFNSLDETRTEFFPTLSVYEGQNLRSAVSFWTVEERFDSTFFFVQSMTEPGALNFLENFNSFPPAQTNEGLEPASAYHWANDISQLSKSLGADGVERFFDSFSELAPAFNAAQIQLNQSYGDSSAQGFSLGIRRMLLSKPRIPTDNNNAFPISNELESLFVFAEQANQPSRGLFSFLSEQFRRSPDLIVTLFEKMKEHLAPLVTKSIQSQIIRSLFTGENALTIEQWKKFPRKDKADPTPEFLEVLSSVREAIMTVTTLENNVEKITAPFAMTLFLERLFLHNREAVGKLKDSHELFELEWKVPPDAAVSYFELDEDKLIFKFESEFKFFQIPSLIAEIQTRYTTEIDTGFDFFFDPPEGTLNDILLSIVEVALEARNLNAGQSFSKALLVTFTGGESEIPFSLADLETESILFSLNQLSATLSIKKLRLFKNIAFQTLGLSELKKSDVVTLASLYEERPDLQEKLVTLLTTLHSLDELDKSVNDLPSPFLTYHYWIRHLSVEQMNHVGTLFETVQKAGIFSGVEGTNQVRYEAFYRSLVGAPEQLAYLLGQIGKIERKQIFDFSLWLQQVSDASLFALAWTQWQEFTRTHLPALRIGLEQVPKLWLPKAAFEWLHHTFSNPEKKDVLRLLISKTDDARLRPLLDAFIDLTRSDAKWTAFTEHIKLLADSRWQEIGKSMQSPRVRLFLHQGFSFLKDLLGSIEPTPLDSEEPVFPNLHFEFN